MTAVQPPSTAPTSLAAALLRAGYPVDGSRLAAAAATILAKHGNTPKALAAFEEVVQSDRALLRALAADYLNDRALDMSGEALRGGANLELPDNRHSASAPAAHPHDDDAGHSRRARSGQEDPAPSSLPVPSGGGHVKDATRRLADASPARKSNPPRGLAAIASVQQTMARSILDTFKLRDGRALGDVQWSELLHIAAANDRESRVLRAVYGYAHNVDPSSRVRDVVRPAFVEDAIKSAEAAHDAA